MTRVSVFRTMVVAAVLGIPGVASAVGDMPLRLTQREARAHYAAVRSLLTANGITCPVGQRPLSGTVSGGASPAGGSQTVTLAFDGGATVRIVKTWTTEEPDHHQAVTTQLTCSLRQ